MTDIVEAFRKCRKETDFYRIQIALENCLAPAEVAGLADRRIELPGPARAWLDQMLDRLFREIGEPRPYTGLPLSEHVWFYGHAPDEPRRPDLLLAFCGNAQRLMMPVSVALQHIESSRFDVVVFTDPARQAYISGIKGYGADAAAVLDRAGRDVNLAAYRSVRCLGTSGGGASALRAGCLLAAERAVCIGGRPIEEYGSLGKAAVKAAPAFNADFRRARGTDTRFICVYGAEHERDRIGAHHLAERLPAELVPIPGVEQHNALFEILKEGRMGRFMDDLLLADAPAKAPSAVE